MIGATDADVCRRYGEEVRQKDLVDCVRATQARRYGQDIEIIFGEREIVDRLAHVTGVGPSIKDSATGEIDEEHRVRHRCIRQAACGSDCLHRAAQIDLMHDPCGGRITNIDNGQSARSIGHGKEISGAGDALRVARCVELRNSDRVWAGDVKYGDTRLAIGENGQIVQGTDINRHSRRSRRRDDSRLRGPPIQRIGALVCFRTVRNSVPITVGIRGVGAVNRFHHIGQAILIEVGEGTVERKQSY